jgi:hypothetical protein
MGRRIGSGRVARPRIGRVRPIPISRAGWRNRRRAGRRVGLNGMARDSGVRTDLAIAGPLRAYGAGRRRLRSRGHWRQAAGKGKLTLDRADALRVRGIGSTRCRRGVCRGSCGAAGRAPSGVRPRRFHLAGLASVWQRHGESTRLPRGIERHADQTRWFDRRCRDRLCRGLLILRVRATQSLPAGRPRQRGGTNPLPRGARTGLVQAVKGIFGCRAGLLRRAKRAPAFPGQHFQGPQVPAVRWRRRRGVSRNRKAGRLRGLVLPLRVLLFGERRPKPRGPRGRLPRDTRVGVCWLAGNRRGGIGWGPPIDTVRSGLNRDARHAVVPCRSAAKNGGARFQGLKAARCAKKLPRRDARGKIMPPTPSRPINRE